MKKIRRILAIILVMALCASHSAVALAKSNRNHGSDDKHGIGGGDSVLSPDVEILKTLGLLIGASKDGLTEEYTKSKPTRMQGFVIYLRLINEEFDMEQFRYKDGDDNFEDHHGHSGYVKKVMAYAKAHPEFNWVGSSGRFNPLAHLTAKEYAKIMLTALGYEYNADFYWNNVESFAEGLGLDVPEGAFRMEELATMTVQTLYTIMKTTGKTLIDYLASVNPDFAAKVALLEDDITTDTTKPTVSDLVLSAPGQVTVYFSEPITVSTLSTLVNYAVDPDGTAAAAGKTLLSELGGAKAVPSADKESVVLTIPGIVITGGTAAGQGVTDITISGLKDAAGNTLDTITRFVRKEAALSVVSAAAINGNKLQVTFNNPMKTVDPTEFKLNRSDGTTPAAVGTAYTADAAGKVITVTLGSSLTATAKAAETDTTTAKLVIGTSATEDIFGNAVSGAVTVPAVSESTPATVMIQDKIEPAVALLNKGTAPYTFELVFTEPVDAKDRATLSAALKISTLSGTAKTAAFAFGGGDGTLRNFTTLTATIAGTDSKYSIELLGQGLCDLSGNTVRAMAKTTLTVTVNEAPVITSAETQDLDKDGFLDAVKLVFSKNIKDSTVSAAAFEVAGYSAETFASATAGDTADNNVIYITFTESGTADTGVKPAIAYTQGILEDLDGNKMNSTGPVATADKAAPVVMNALPAGVLTAGGPGAVLVLSEDITAASRVTVSAAVQLKAAVHDNAVIGDMVRSYLWTTDRVFTVSVAANDNGGTDPDTIVLNAASADLIDLAGNITAAAPVVR